MEALGDAAAYTSYSARAFEATCRFYEAQLGCTAVFAWDRPDSRGVYYNLAHPADARNVLYCRDRS